MQSALSVHHVNVVVQTATYLNNSKKGFYTPFLQHILRIEYILYSEVIVE